ncbi:UDP-N-acetylglucosamine 1-carboxyvinyltransferase [Kordiimonas sp. SCSIO 12603]|uniref:UDP-N-acetylglucosamine 1-carboxyvinyltransferase n=1 Tax=Kordiimonas sp. SCSIO 12603 TaxID=2829596 RepID=UPI0021033859|nr:UDP-N-acetylglucosamine 1-carboxyvinyltransferase [Kordiimonas sp. SCSIO 12603]UTW59403.1 UDP-N-acetylglucosamine 1-carboxyvinyltransferase [Kordiimonas sp. SCSIO 12603]
MEKLVIRGGKKLEGTIPISGAKNAALPLMCTPLLTDEPVTLTNLPRLADISTLSDLLNHLGVTITIEGGKGGKIRGRSLTFSAGNIADTVAPYDMVRKMRASILVLGPLVARAGEAIVSLPGGCAIGNRPIDLHLKALEAIGAKIELENGYVRASAPEGLKGGTVRFPFVSVGATENILMAAALAKGTTIIENAAREPEIADLAKCLNAMGAKITGAGHETITVEGVEKLHGCTHDVIPDRVEAGSYAVAALMTRGNILLEGAKAEHMQAALDVLTEAGAIVTEEENGVRVKSNGHLGGFNIVTQPFPGFPTDMQAQFMALAAVSDGASVINEAIFENRYMHVPELSRLGADITVSGSSATVRGVDKLVGAPVMATDLRASMSLALAGLVAEGETHVNRLYHLDRGYERLEEKLRQVGADIERVPT